MLTHVLHLAPGDDLRPSLERAFAELSAQRGIKAACIVSGIGSLTRALLRYAQQPEGSLIEGPLELLTLAGTLSVDGAHLHASVSDERGNVKGGHVVPGCIVRTTAEVVIALLPEWEFRREMDVQTGYPELVAKHDHSV